MRTKTTKLPHKTTSKPLRNAPLSQVAFEVNFPNSFAVETGIAAYQQRVDSFFPKSSAEYIVRLPTAVAFGKSPTQTSTELTPMRSFVFQNSKGSRVVRVSVLNFTVLVTDYLHFEDYVASLTAALTPAIETFQLHHVERIGLRYINQIPIPAAGAEVHYKKYVRTPLSADAVSGHIATNFLTEITAEIDNTKKLTVRSGLLPLQADDANRTYLLDFDCYSIGSRVTLSGADLTNLLVEYHEIIEAEFTQAVTDKYWKYMAEGTPL